MLQKGQSAPRVQSTSRLLFQWSMLPGNCLNSKSILISFHMYSKCIIQTFNIFLNSLWVVRTIRICLHSVFTPLAYSLILLFSPSLPFLPWGETRPRLLIKVCLQSVCAFIRRHWREALDLRPVHTGCIHTLKTSRESAMEINRSVLKSFYNSMGYTANHELCYIKMQ